MHVRDLPKTGTCEVFWFDPKAKGVYRSFPRCSELSGKMTDKQALAKRDHDASRRWGTTNISPAGARQL